MAELQELLEKVKTYDWGQSRLALTEVSDIIKAAFGSPAKLREIERSLIGVLESDAKYAGKQFVCRKLSIIGTKQSVPALAEMLIKPKFSDMARYALERIPDESVDEALRDALPKTSGKTKVGIINSLGERRDSKAATALSSLIYDSDDMVAGSAIAALGKIGGRRATKALARAKGETSGKLRMLVLDAFLSCADQLAAKGRRKQAVAIYKELSEKGLPEPIRAAAAIGRLNVIKKGRTPLRGNPKR
ncbi:MAG: HEAT repeat domain-containing protein [Sedimentisphaerales bacterium]